MGGHEHQKVGLVCIQYRQGDYCLTYSPSWYPCTPLVLIGSPVQGHRFRSSRHPILLRTTRLYNSVGAFLLYHVSPSPENDSIFAIQLMFNLRQSRQEFRSKEPIFLIRFWPSQVMDTPFESSSLFRSLGKASRIAHHDMDG